MTGLLPRVEKISGRLGAGVATQVHVFVPREEEKLNQKGSLLAVVVVKSQQEGISIGLGKEVVMRLQEEYYGKDNQTLPGLVGAIENISEEFGQVGQVEVVAVVWKTGAWYVAIKGEGAVYMQRAGQTGKILEGTGLVQTASGFGQEYDQVLLVSTELKKVLAEGTIRAILSGKSLLTAKEMLAPVVETQAENSGMGAVLSLLARPEEVEVMAEPEKFEPTPQASWRKSWNWQEVWEEVKANLPRGERQNNTKTILMAGVLLAVLVGGAVWGGKLRHKETVSLDNRVILDQIDQKQQEARGLTSLNPIKAREVLKEAVALVNTNQDRLANEPNYTSLKTQLEQDLEALTKNYSLELEVVFDLELIKAGGKSSDEVRAEKQMYVADAGLESIYKIGLIDQKTSIVMAGQLLEGLKGVAMVNQKLVALANEGIVGVEKDKEKQKVVISIDEGGRLIRSFGSNVYVVGSNQIYQYVGTESGFGSKKEWLKEERELGGVKQMRIDGFVWLLEEGNGLWKYSRGLGERVVLKGVEGQMGVGDFYTDQDQVNLYLLDQEGGRVVVVDKEGVYKAQYSNPQIKTSERLVVSEEDKKIWLVAKNKIWAGELKE